MNHGTQPSPAESAAMCGTDWFAFDAVSGFGAPSELFSADFALSFLSEDPPFELACEDPFPLLPELDPVEEPVALEPPVVGALEEELGATGIVDWPVPLELGPDELGLPPPLLPPTPGRADPYWSWEGDVAPAAGAITAAKSASTATAIANRGM